MSKHLSIFEETKIYVLCPANLKTGGTELLHQLVYTLNNCGRDAFITYYFEGKFNKDDPTPDAFKKYITNKTISISMIKDDSKNIIVFPEVCIGKQKRFKIIQKCVWWLSVDNYKETKGMINRLKKYGVLSFIKHLFLNDYVRLRDVKAIQTHLYQSYFALDFIKSLGINESHTAYLSDYLNEIYINNVPSNRERQNVVIYNPKKGKEFTDKIIKSSNDVNYVPIINMSNSQVIELMRSSKVYIDFGNHPGKDRIPREAAMCGCCIITGKRGSAAYNRDVPIPEKYKFDDNEDNIHSIVNQIKRCIAEYDVTIKDFDGYRMIISKEKDGFVSAVRSIFGV